MAHLMWNALAGQSGAQGLDWNGNESVMGSAGATITIAAADLVTMLIFLPDTQVTNEGRSPGGDKFYKARNALGGSAGATFSGHTAAVTASRGVVLTHTASGNTMDVRNSHAFATAVASLCQSTLKTVARILSRMK